MHDASMKSPERGKSRWRDFGLRSLVWAGLFLVLAAGAQTTISSWPQRHSNQLPGDPDSDLGQPNVQNSIDMEKRLRVLNAERQKSLVSDTNKLLKLAKELETETSADKSDVLTADQMRKVAEIEKLARSVKEKMSTSVRSVPPVFQPPTIMPSER